MRTTLNIDDEILEAARSLADEWNLPVSAVLSELARRGLRRLGTGRRRHKGFPVFDVLRGSTPLTLGRVKRHEDAP